MTESDPPVPISKDSTPSVFAPEAWAGATLAATRRYYEQLLLAQVHVPAKGLWHADDRFFVELPGGEDPAHLMTSEGEPLASWLKAHRGSFASELIFVSQLPEGARRVPTRDAAALARLDGESRNRAEVDLDFGLALPRDFPPYALEAKLDTSPRTVLLCTEAPLTDEERGQAVGAWAQLKSPLVLEFLVDATMQGRPKEGLKRMDGDITLLASRRLPTNLGQEARWAYEEDEQLWCDHRERLLSTDDVKLRDVLPRAVRSDASACVLAASPGAPPNPRMFLPIYEQVILGAPLAERYDEFLASINAPLNDVVELARDGRVRFIAPQSPDRYPSELISRLSEEAPESIIFSRRLAAAMVIDARRRMPLFYPPVGIDDRHKMLTVLAHLGDEVRGQDVEAKWLSAVSAEVQRHWAGAERLLHRYGATAALFDGLGALAARLIRTYHGRDLLIEMMSAGASVQWAAALDATIVPQSHASYSEDAAVEYCATLYSGVAPKPVSLPRGDMTAVVQGLLCIDNDAPIKEIASVFSGTDLDRLRSVVSDIAKSNLDPDFLREAIEGFNAKVKRYERNAARLAKLNLVGAAAALAALAAVPASPTIPITLWAIGQLLTGPEPGGRAGHLIDTVRGANSWTTPGVVLVSRLARELRSA